MNQYPSQFLKQNPLAVLNILRDLQRDKVALRVSWETGQFISRLLDVTPQHLVLDFGSQEYENRAVQRAQDISLSAETAGAKIAFTASGVQAGEYLGLPAFYLPLPPSLWFVQRRAYFRIAVPVQTRYYGTVTLNSTQPLRFRLCDLSLGGMGVLLETQPAESLKAGMRFSSLELDMGQWGSFTFDAQLIAISEHKVVDHKNETISTPRLSLRFLNVNPAAERSLQRIVFALEREARDRANNVRDRTAT